MTLLLLSAILLFVRRFIPKGNVVHEVLSLPAYLLKVYRAPVKDMTVEKHFFGQQRRQYLLLCRPKEGPIIQKDVILYHHGGGWAFGSPEMLLMNAQFFVKLGYCVLLPSYRRTPRYRFPHIWEDLMGSLQKGLELMEQHQLGGQKIILAGMSAGGNLAALTMYRRAALQQAGFSPDLFKGILLFGAPLDTRLMASTPVLYAYCGSKKGELFPQANPIEHLEAGENRPILCIHGKLDGMVPYKGTAQFIQKRREIGPAENVEFHTMEEGTHLDAGSWGFEDNDLRDRIQEWLARQ
ncbi:MAG: alpha/beta hydrolase [Bacteroidota bacterium]